MKVKIEFDDVQALTLAGFLQSTYPEASRERHCLTAWQILRMASGFVSGAIEPEVGRCSDACNEQHTYELPGCELGFSEGERELYDLCHCNAPVIDESSIHYPYRRGMCERCAEVRCDAFPGACA